MEARPAHDHDRPILNAATKVELVIVSPALTTRDVPCDAQAFQYLHSRYAFCVFVLQRLTVVVSLLRLSVARLQKGIQLFHD